MMGGSVLPPSHMAASVNAWAGPLTPVALRLVSGNTYALVDVLGREVNPPSDPPVYISGGVEDGVYLAPSTHSNLAPFAAPRVQDLAYFAGETLADAAMASPVLRIASGWESGVVLSSAARTNLAPYSQDVSQWDYRGGMPIPTSGQLAPDGTYTAWILSDDTNTREHYIQSSSVHVVAGRVVQRLYVKAGTIVKVGLQNNVNGAYRRAKFDLITGTVISKDLGIATITSIPGGWGWLIEWERTETVEASRAFIVQTLNALGSHSYAGTGQSFTAWGHVITQTDGRYIPTTSDPVTITDYALGTFQPDGSLPVTLAQPADALSWDNAPDGCALVQTDSTHYTLTQPYVSDTNLIGYAALSWGSDDVAAFQRVSASTATVYSAALLVQVSGGAPTLDLLRPELRGDATGTITMTYRAIPGDTDIYRCEFSGIQVASITSGYFGFRRGTDTRPCVTGPWQFGQGVGRFLSGGTAEADYTREGSRMTLTRPCSETLEAEWA